MKNAYAVMLILILAGCTAQNEMVPLSDDFEIIICDAITPCSEGLECISFQDLETPICWQGDPCDRCTSNNCIQLESYPPQIRCI
ncbi:MAG: hypothetical protein WC393_02720 [Candidatus Nanoarchaeia archaeon]|jgi:hypothetical protein